MRELTIRDRYGSHVSPEEIEDFVGVNQYDCVLDIGCGTGEKTRYFRRFSKRVIGLDIDKQILTGQPDTVCHDAHYLPFEDQLFDFIICCAVIEHLEEPYKCISESERVLRKGGLLFILNPVLNSSPKLIRLYRAILGKPVEEIHQQVLSTKDVTSMLHKAGFKIIKVKHNIFLYTLIESLFGKKITILTSFPESGFTKRLASEVYILARKRSRGTP